MIDKQPPVYTLTIQGRPISHKDYKTSSGHAYDPQAALKEKIRWEFRSQFPHAPIEGLVRIDATYYFPVPQCKLAKFKKKPDNLWYYSNTPDCDNANKLYYDCMKLIIMDDDRYVVDGYTRKLYDTNPRSVFIVTSLGAHYERL